MPELSIVIPSFEEMANLPPLIEELNGICTEHNLDIEVILSDDASQDDTLEMAKELQNHYPDLHMRILHRYAPRRGYGAVLRYGLAHAAGRFVVVVAANRQNPIELIPEMLGRARKGAHLVQCSRYSSPKEANVPWIFRFYQVIFRGLVRFLLGREIPDSTYGFKLFDRVLVMAMGVTQNRYNVNPEIVFKVLLAGGKIEFVSGDQREREAGAAKFRLYRELDGFLYVLLRASLHRFGFLWF